MPEIALPTGIIDYHDTGSGPPVVLVHGALVNAEVWRPLIERLEASHRCIAPELPLGSHRRAMPRDADITPHGVARLIGELLEALDLRDVTLIGNDTGGGLSQLVALDHGQRVGRLVLTNCDAFETFPPKAFVPLFRLARVPGVLRAIYQPMRLAAARRLPLAFGWLGRDLDDELTRGWVEPVLRDRGVRRDISRFLRGVKPSVLLDAGARLPTLRVPVLVAWGTADPFFRLDLGRRIAAAIPGARLVEIAGSRTFVSQDAPDALARLVAGFSAAGSS
ncbi:MAG: alpha/beta hydrolase [Solirubrobacteraceae bacterium]